MITRNYAAMISKHLGILETQVSHTLELLNTGATVPFIARYRKEATRDLDEVQIVSIRDLYNKWIELDKRRNVILDSIREQGKLTPALERQLNEAVTMTKLEDLYLPYRPKRKTRASVAIERGLEPLAKLLLQQNRMSVEETAHRFVNEEKGVNTIEDALAGARDIIAEWISEDAFLRDKMRRLFQKNAKIVSKVVKNKEEEGSKYKIYFNSEENISKAPSHRILAMFRGEEEGILRLSIMPDEEQAMDIIDQQYIKADNECADEVSVACLDAYKRLLQPQMDTETRKIYKERADIEAIKVFAANLRQLLLAAPLGQKTVLAIDPGFRTGCKTVVLDKQGNLLHNETIYPNSPQEEYEISSEKLKQWVEKYEVEAIAIGNGTAGRETEYFVRSIPFERKVTIVVVSENGASVYSASEVARAEFPNHDVTVRGAVSIGRRLMDPLAELVKIDPKSIGVGQYQHDVNQNRLQQSLLDVVESCVNYVGVEVNTASKELLSFVSGVGPTLAKNIVEYRTANGPFLSRSQLKKIPRFGEKAFEQAAGFLRIHGAKNPLDDSAVHPESYYIVDKMAQSLSCTVADLLKNDILRKSINLKMFAADKIGMPTLKDIMKELIKPGRDPREHFDAFEFDSTISTINDLRPGMVVPGIITNITNFGCFVDIGIHQNGLIHVSQIANKYVSDLNQVLKLHQKVTVKIIEVDIPRKRISLSMRGEEQ